MFCVEYNYGVCTDRECDQPHWCAICFKFGHNARQHRIQPLSSPNLQETIYFFGGWRNPQLMMYHNLWWDQAKGTSREYKKRWKLVRWKGHLHGHTSTKHYLLAIRDMFTLACFFHLYGSFDSHFPAGICFYVCMCTCVYVCVCLCVSLCVWGKSLVLCLFMWVCMCIRLILILNPLFNGSQNIIFAFYYQREK